VRSGRKVTDLKILSQRAIRYGQEHVTDSQNRIVSKHRGEIRGE
jgi:hypothetical protein